MSLNKLKLLIVFSVIIIIPVFVGCVKQSPQRSDEYEKVTLSASWEYNYADVEELTRNSDLIAVVKIIDSKSDEMNSDINIKMTRFSAEVKESIFGEDSENIQMEMTGGIDENDKKIYEIEDDPLMKKGDEFLIFAKRNQDATYTILSGAQGRFEIENDEVYSLNVIDEQVKNSNSCSNIKVNGESKETFVGRIQRALGE